MTEATFTFRLDGQLKKQFTVAAKNRDRSGAQLLRDFMRDFVQQRQDAHDYDNWFRQQVQAGLQSAATDPLLTNNKVEVQAAAWRKKAAAKNARR